VAQSIEILVIIIVSVTSTFLNCHFNAKRRSSGIKGKIGGNLKQRGNALCLRGMGAPGIDACLQRPPVVHISLLASC